MRWLFVSSALICPFVKANVATQNYFDIRKELSSQHCLKDAHRGVYTAEMSKKELVFDFICPDKVYISSEIFSPFVFISNGSQAWIIHKPEKGKIGKDSEVEYYPNAQNRWHYLGMTLFQALPKVVDEQVQAEAKEISDSYNLNRISVEGGFQVTASAKQEKLPNLTLHYKAKEALPHRIEFGALPNVKLDLVRSRLEKNPKLDPWVFYPDVSTAKKVYTH